MQDVMDISSQYKSNAERILETTKLTESLAKIGKVSFEGSFAYDLMLGPDIDIYVITKNLSRRKVRNLVVDLIDANQFSMYQFTNYFDQGLFNEHHKNRHGFPDGYYLGLGYWLDDQKWKIDIWFTESKNKNNKYYADLVDKCCDEQKKKTILEIKKYREDNNLKIDGVRIYNAVLCDGVKSVKEFLKRV